jgi:hypothetical protein
MRILVEHAPGIWRYVATLSPYNLPDGGFAFIPAYRGFDGHVMKIKLKDTYSHLVHPQPPVILDGRSVSHRVKASFHHDGSTQINGADSSISVTAGREPDGAFKGMGILGRPFARPVNSGSVIGMTAWGLSFYPTRPFDSKRTIRFSRTELGKKGLLERAAVLVQGYLIRRSEKVRVVSEYPDLRIQTVRWNGILGIRQDMELRVCNLYSPDAYLAIDCSRIPLPKVDGNPAGYMMSTQRDPLEDIGLQVVFPAPRGARAVSGLAESGFPWEAE